MAANCSFSTESLEKRYLKKASGIIFMTVSTPLSKDTMSRFLPTGSLVPGNHTLWGLQARRSKTMRISRVSHPSSVQAAARMCHITTGNTKMLTAISPGIIPRAAAALFDRLAGPPPLLRHGSSGLRTPTRYSTSSPPTPASLAKANAHDNWQLKATYVEVTLYF